MASEREIAPEHRGASNRHCRRNGQIWLGPLGKMERAKFDMAISLGQKPDDETVVASIKKVMVHLFSAVMRKKVSSTDQKNCIKLDENIKRFIIDFVSQRLGKFDDIESKLKNVLSRKVY